MTPTSREQERAVSDKHPGGRMRRFAFPTEPDDTIDVFYPSDPRAAAAVDVVVAIVLDEGYREIEAPQPS